MELLWNFLPKIEQVSAKSLFLAESCIGEIKFWVRLCNCMRSMNEVFGGAIYVGTFHREFNNQSE